MHPEILEYWERKGKRVLTWDTLIGSQTIWYYEIPNQDKYWVSFTDPNVIAVFTHKSILPNFKPHFTYIIDNHYYDEAEAVRIYKLLAFL